MTIGAQATPNLQLREKFNMPSLINTRTRAKVYLVIAALALICAALRWMPMLNQELQIERNVNQASVPHPDAPTTINYNHSRMPTNPIQKETASDRTVGAGTETLSSHLEETNSRTRGDASSEVELAEIAAAAKALADERALWAAAMTGDWKAAHEGLIAAIECSNGRITRFSLAEICQRLTNNIDALEQILRSHSANVTEASRALQEYEWTRKEMSRRSSYLVPVARGAAAQIAVTHPESVNGR